MSVSRREHKLGPISLVIQTDVQGADVEELPAEVDSQNRRRIGIWIAYGFLVILAALSLLYALIPFYLSGFQNLSVTQIEMANLWLWDFKDYPLFAFGGDVLPLVTLLWVPFGYALLPGLFVEFLLNFSRSSRRTNLVKLVLLLALLFVATLVWAALSDKLFVLLMD